MGRWSFLHHQSQPGVICNSVSHLDNESISSYFLQKPKNPQIRNYDTDASLEIFKALNRNPQRCGLYIEGF